MEERVFIECGYNICSEIISVELLENGNPFYTYADGDWGVSFREDRPYNTREIHRESEIPEEMVRNKVLVEDTKYILSESKYGSFDDVVAQLAYLEQSERGHSRSPVHQFLDQKYMMFISRHLNRGVMHNIISLYNPTATDCGNITLTRNSSDAKRLRGTTMKPGRAFRHMFPKLPDTAVAELAEAYIEHVSPREFKLIVSDTAKHFAKAYDGACTSYRNPSCSYINKSLATSCMQGVGRDIDGVYYSAGECYASGDFTIAYLEDTVGHVAGRVVIGKAGSDGVRKHGPVYGSCEQSLEMLHTYLLSIDAVFADDEGWVGLNLTLIGDESDAVAPYLDGDYSGDIVGEFIIILQRGDGRYSFDSTDGYLGNGNICEGCEDGIDEDVTYTDEDGYCFCEHCFFERYTYNNRGELIDADDAVQAMTRSTFSNRNFMITCHVDEVVYIASLNEYWLLEDCEYLGDEDEYYPTHLIPVAEIEEAA